MEHAWRLAACLVATCALGSGCAPSTVLIRGPTEPAPVGAGAARLTVSRAGSWTGSDTSYFVYWRTRGITDNTAHAICRVRPGFRLAFWGPMTWVVANDGGHVVFDATAYLQAKTIPVVVPTIYSWSGPERERSDPGEQIRPKGRLRAPTSEEVARAGAEASAPPVPADLDQVTRGLDAERRKGRFRAPTAEEVARLPQVQRYARVFAPASRDTSAEEEGAIAVPSWSRIMGPQFGNEIQTESTRQSTWVVSQALSLDWAAFEKELCEELILGTAIAFLGPGGTATVATRPGDVRLEVSEAIKSPGGADASQRLGSLVSGAPVTLQFEPGTSLEYQFIGDRSQKTLRVERK